jgi:hypothetical protein
MISIISCLKFKLNFMLCCLQLCHCVIALIKIPLIYDDDVNRLGDIMYTINKNTQTLNNANMEVGLEVNVEKTKCILMSRVQIVGQNREIKIGNRSSVNASQFY